MVRIVRLGSRNRRSQARDKTRRTLPHPRMRIMGEGKVGQGAHGEFPTGYSAKTKRNKILALIDKLRVNA